MQDSVCSEVNTEILKEVVPLIIHWYRENRRMLPWRADPSPYHSWLAEIMLQQTRIEAVIPYYERFLRELPDITALAAVSEDRLMKLWEGLGYYSRAKNLKKAAVMVAEQHSGNLPASLSALKRLPGIGDYTAGAISSIAFGLPEPAVDGNVLRVLMRLFADGSDITNPSLRKDVTSVLREIYPRGEEAALLTEGLMELGEVICLPNVRPRCAQCPLQGFCRSHKTGEELKYPYIPPKKERRIEELTVLLILCKGRYAIRKRTGNGLLSGLWEFPNMAGHLTSEEIKELLQPEEIVPCGGSRHVFTHVEWHMIGYKLEVGEQVSDYLWKTAEEIREEFSLPTAFRFYQKQLS